MPSGTTTKSCLTCHAQFTGNTRRLYCSPKCKLLAGSGGSDACWLWSGQIDSRGYGKMRWGQKILRPHRAAYEAFVGEIPAGLFVCHRCDTPLCFNPDHLFVGTAKENSRDAIVKGRQHRGERTGSSKLTEDQVRLARASTASIGELARTFGVTAQSMYCVRTRRTWRHI